MIGKFRTRFKKILIECISNSLDIRMCNKIGKKIEPLFDIYKVSGISEKIVIQTMDAAKILIDYFFEKEKPYRLIDEIINANFFGIDSYPITIYNLNVLLEEIEKMGYRYDKKLKRVVLIDKYNNLVNWGYLEENEEYHFCFVSIDIVENSKIVRKNNPQNISETYRYFYEILKNKITIRDGRIWIWEGDGGIIAFQGENAINRAVYALFDFVLSQPVINSIYNLLNKEIKYRIAINPGKAIFKNDIDKIRSDELDRVRELEKTTTPGYMIITKITWQSLNSSLQNLFKSIDSKDNEGLYYLHYKDGREPLK